MDIVLMDILPICTDSLYVHTHYGLTPIRTCPLYRHKPYRDISLIWTYLYMNIFLLGTYSLYTHTTIWTYPYMDLTI